MTRVAMAAGPTPRAQGASMIERVASILDALLRHDAQLRVSELARDTGLAKSTVSRIVAELVDEGFLERTDTGVRLGMRLFELGESAHRPRDLRRLSLAAMSDLRAATNLTVHLAVRERDEVVYVSILRARDAPAFPSRVAGRMPAHATAVGKALLATAPAALAGALLERELEQVGPHTLTDPAMLRRQLARVRTEGLAYESEESGPGLACVAAPILDAHGHGLAAISAAGSTAEVDFRRVGPLVLATARSISRLIERRPSPPILSDALH